MDETKLWERLVKALPIIGGLAAIVAPTAVNIAIFFAVLSLNNGIRTELAAQQAGAQALRAELQALYSEFQTLRAEIRDLDDVVDALSADDMDLKIGYAEVSGRLDSIEARLAAVERRLPDVEYVDGRFDDLERELAALKERVASLYDDGAE